jgi:ribosome-associated protein
LPKHISEKLLQHLAQAADEKKALDIRAYKLNNTSVTDFALVVSAKNPVHIKALFKELDMASDAFLKQNADADFFEHAKISGTSDSGWIILDVNVIIVHIISQDIRQYYELDQLFEQRGVVYHF